MAASRASAMASAITSSLDFFISAYITLQSQNARPYNLPSWFTHEGMFEEAAYIPQGWASEDANSYIALSNVSRGAIEPHFMRSDQAVHPMKVQLPGYNGRPIAFMVRRPFADVTSDTALTHADRDYVVQRAIQKLSGDFTAGRNASRLAKLLDYGRPRIRIRQSPLVSV